jgi:hypothetical protein
MVGNEPRVSLAQVIRTVRPIDGGLALGRRTQSDSGGVLMAVACVAIAVLLYAIVSLVWGGGDEGEDGALVSRRSSPITVSGSSRAST